MPRTINKMSMDMRQLGEFFVDTRDPDLAIKASNIIHDATLALKQLREEYEDKEYFDSCVKVTLSSWGYAGSDYSTSVINLEEYDSGEPSEDYQPMKSDAVEKAFEALSAENK